jgi:hypothetical protein
MNNWFAVGTVIGIIVFTIMSVSMFTSYILNFYSKIWADTLLGEMAQDVIDFKEGLFNIEKHSIYASFMMYMTLAVLQNLLCALICFVLSYFVLILVLIGIVALILVKIIKKNQNKNN